MSRTSEKQPLNPNTGLNICPSGVSKQVLGWTCLEIQVLWICFIKTLSPGSGGRTSVSRVHWKDWCWSWNSNTLATSCEELTHWKRPWCWERLKAGGEGDDRGWDGWMASLTRWTWVWVDSGSWKSSLNIWKIMFHVLLKSGLENFEHYFASVWDECNCMVVGAFFSILQYSCLEDPMNSMERPSGTSKLNHSLRLLLHTHQNG